MTLLKSFFVTGALTGALALSACGEQKPPAPPPEPPASTPTAAAVDPTCPTLAIKGEIGKPTAGKVTFTVSPVPPGVTNWNWATTAGAIVEGQGTTTIVVEDSTPGDLITVTAEARGLDASCAPEKAYASTTAQMP